MSNDPADRGEASRLAAALFVCLCAMTFFGVPASAEQPAPLAASALPPGTPEAASEVARLEALWKDWRERTKTLRVEGWRFIGICRKPETAVTREELMTLIFEQLMPLVESGTPDLPALDGIVSDLFPTGPTAWRESGLGRNGWYRFNLQAGASGQRVDLENADRHQVRVRKDGEEQTYDSTIAQVSLLPTESGFRVETIGDFLYTPQLTGLPGLRVEQGLGERQRLTNGRFILEYSAETGFPYLDSRHPLFDRIQELPTLMSDEGVPFARVVVRIQYQSDKSGALRVDYATIYLLESVTANAPVTDEDLQIAVPAGTNIVDFGREIPALKEKGKAHHVSRRTREPVNDALEVSKQPDFAPPALLNNSAQYQRDQVIEQHWARWQTVLVINAAILLVAVVWMLVRWRRNTKS